MMKQRAIGAARKMLKYTTLVFLALCCFFPNCCSARDICTAIQNGSQTIYRITGSNFSTLDDCQYNWMDSTERLIAHEKEKDPKLVVSGSIDSLTVNECIESLKYQRDCISEGSPSTAHCAINCTTASRTAEDPSKSDPTGKEDPDPTVWIIVLAVTLLVIFAIVMCCIRKNEIHRFCTRVDELVRGNKQPAPRVTGSQAEPPADSCVEVLIGEQ